MRMWKGGITLLLALVLLVSVTGCGVQEGSEKVEQGGSIGTETLSRSYVAEIEKTCAEFYDIFGVAGLSVGIYDNGKTTFFNYGKTEWGSDDVTEHTQFEIASITKTFVAC